MTHIVIVLYHHCFGNTTPIDPVTAIHVYYMQSSTGEYILYSAYFPDI